MIILPLNLHSFVIFSISGDLKLVEKPSPVTLAAHDFSNIKVCTYCLNKKYTFSIKSKIYLFSLGFI